MVRFKFPGERDSDAESQGADLIVMGVRKGAAWPRPIDLGHCLRHGVPRALSGSDGAAENVAGMRCGRFYAVPLFFEGSLLLTKRDRLGFGLPFIEECQQILGAEGPGLFELAILLAVQQFSFPVEDGKRRNTTIHRNFILLH